MNDETPTPADDDAVARDAAHWVLRQDRGLTAAEQDAFSQWLAGRAEHRAAWADHRRGWEELDRLAGLQSSVCAVPDPDLLAPRRGVFFRRCLRFAPLALAAAAALAIGIFLRAPGAGPRAAPIPAPPPPRPAVAQIEQRALPDGSVVQLNRGSVLAVEFTPTERRVRLVCGEASFTVAKNPARPFIVVAHGVQVKAVGTVFNVRLGSAAVEVLVTEGKVRVDHPDEHSPTGMSAAVPLLAAGENAVVPLAPATPVPPIAALSTNQIEERLAWQPRLLDFAEAPLADIAAEFNRHNSVRLTLGEPALEALRLSASFRSDNVEGFVRLMESDFGMIAERRDEATIVLHRAR